MNIGKIKAAIRDIPDFPQTGILFKDITPVLQDGAMFAQVVDFIASKYKHTTPTKIVAIESRGFIFGTALAYKFKAGLIPIRKKGKLPHKTYEASYDLEYGSATVEIHQDALTKKDKVIIIDDLLATGGTARAAIQLVNKFGAEILGIEFVIELAFLKGRQKLNGYPVNSLVVF